MGLGKFFGRSRKESKPLSPKQEIPIPLAQPKEETNKEEFYHLFGYEVISPCEIGELKKYGFPPENLKEAALRFNHAISGRPYSLTFHFSQTIGHWYLPLTQETTPSDEEEFTAIEEIIIKALSANVHIDRKVGRSTRQDSKLVETLEVGILDADSIAVLGERLEEPCEGAVLITDVEACIRYKNILKRSYLAVKKAMPYLREDRSFTKVTIRRKEL